MRKHISDGEILPCNAKPGDCPVDGGRFFETQEEAERALALENGGTFQSMKRERKIYAPEKPSIPLVTQAEAIEGINRLRENSLAQMRKKYSNLSEEELHEYLPQVLKNEVLGYGLLGSSVFGLETPESDRDILVITDGKGSSVHKVFDDGLDIQVMSRDNVYESIVKSQPNLIDTIKSDSFQVEEKYKPFYDNLRFNSIAYQGRINDHGISDLLNARKDFPKPEFERRAKKALKTSVRNFYMMDRMQRDMLMTTTFTAEEREHFYETFTKAEKMLVKTGDANKVLSYVFERSSGKKLDSSVDWLAEASQTERMKNKLKDE